MLHKIFVETSSIDFNSSRQCFVAQPQNHQNHYQKIHLFSIFDFILISPSISKAQGIFFFFSFYFGNQPASDPLLYFCCYCYRTCMVLESCLAGCKSNMRPLFRWLNLLFILSLALLSILWKILSAKDFPEEFDHSFLINPF